MACNIKTVANVITTNQNFFDEVLVSLHNNDSDVSGLINVIKQLSINELQQSTNLKNDLEELINEVTDVISDFMTDDYTLSSLKSLGVEDPSTKLADVVNNIVESLYDYQDELIDSTKQNPTEGVITNTSVKPSERTNTEIDRVKLEPIRKIKGSGDLSEYHFKGATSAFNKFTSSLKSNALRFGLIDTSKTGTGVVKSNEQLDYNIKTWKSNVFKELFPDKGDLYINGKLREDFQSLLDDKAYSFSDWDVAKLISQSTANTKAFKDYSNVILLNNFDQLVLQYANNVIGVRSNMVDSVNEELTPTTGVYKYHLANTSSLAKSWSESVEELEISYPNGVRIKVQTKNIETIHRLIHLF